MSGNIEVSIAMEPEDDRHPREDRARTSQTILQAGPNTIDQQRRDRASAERMHPHARFLSLEDLSLPVILERQALARGSSHNAAAGDLKSDSSCNVRLLIDSFSDEQILVKDKRGNTALHVAARSGSLGQVEVLVQRVKRAWSIRDENWMPRMKNNDNNTPLHEAVLSRNRDVIGCLLDEDPEPLFWQNKQGKSTLYLAVELGELEILDRLLGISLDPDKYASKVEGKSPVHAAVAYKRLGMLEAMVKKKRPLFDIQSMADYTALHLAVFLSYLPAVELLLREFPSFALRYDDRGYLPIHVACKVGRIRVIMKLLDFCKDPSDLLNEEGQNIIHVAAKYGRSSVVKNLLRDHRLERLINHRDNQGNTALHLAAAYWQPVTLIALTWDQRVDISLTNDKCQSAYDVVCEQDSRIEYESWRQWLSYLPLSRAGAKGSRDLFLRPHDMGELNPRRKLIRTPDLNLMKDKVGTQLIVATLIATVTFAAGFTMPGGFDSSETPNKGFAVMINRSMFQAFVIFDTIATCSSILVVVLLLWTQFTSDPYAFTNIHGLSIMPLNTALLAMSGAFITGIYPVLGKLPWLRNAVLIFGVIFVTMICSLSLVGFIPAGCRSRIIRQIRNYITLGFIFVSGSIHGPSPILVKEEEEHRQSRPNQGFS